MKTPNLDENQVLRALAALAQTQRLRALRALVVAGSAGLNAGALAQQLGLAPSGLSFHLKELAHAGLIHSQPQGRYVIYRADFERMNGLLDYLSEHCCEGQSCELSPRLLNPPKIRSMSTTQPLHVLFLCTHNSARSILAEAALNHLGALDGVPRWRAFSAGSSPRENQQPNPLALRALQDAGISIEGLHSKSWDVFAQPDAPRMDLVITVCDSAAGEACPYWPGQPATAHWGYPDPSSAPGTDADKLLAFKHTLLAIHHRLELLINLPTASVDRLLLQQQARALAQP